MKTKDKLKRQKQREAKASLKLQSTIFPDLKPQQKGTANRSRQEDLLERIKQHKQYSKRTPDGLAINWDVFKMEHKLGKEKPLKTKLDRGHKRKKRWAQG